MDFNLLPSNASFGARPIFASMDPSLKARLSALPSVLDRVQSSVMFAEEASKLGADWVGAAFLRASLADLVSMEETQELDGPRSSILKVRDAKNPLVHFLGLLRHLNIHVKSVSASALAIAASLDNQAFEMKASVITNVTAADLAALRNAKHYVPNDLSRMLTWFTTAQEHWGAGYVFRVGAEAFAAEIASHHGL